MGPGPYFCRHEASHPMNIVIDDGNSRTKLAMFNAADTRLEPQFYQSAEELKSVLQAHTFHNALVSSVRGRSDEILSWIKTEDKKISLTPSIRLPLKINYKTPTTLG